MADRFGVDTLGKYFINSLVTLSASITNVMGIDTRSRIIMGENMMGSVAVSAHGGHYEAAFQKALSMDTFHIAFQNLFFFASVPDRCFTAFAVTLATEIRDISGVGGRLRVTVTFSIMFVMTVNALGGIGIASFG